MNANKRILSGINIRGKPSQGWLEKRGFNGEYLLVSTKSDSVYSKKLAELKPSQKLIVDLYTPIFSGKRIDFVQMETAGLVNAVSEKEMVKKFLKRGNHFLVANHRQKVLD